MRALVRVWEWYWEWYSLRSLQGVIYLKETKMTVWVLIAAMTAVWVGMMGFYLKAFVLDHLILDDDIERD